MDELEFLHIADRTRKAIEVLEATEHKNVLVNLLQLVTLLNERLDEMQEEPDEDDEC